MPDMSQPSRLGLIGCGGIVKVRHLPAELWEVDPENPVRSTAYA